IFASDRGLRIVEGELGAGRVRRQSCRKALRSLRVTATIPIEEILGLLLQMIDVRTKGKLLAHGNLLPFARGQQLAARSWWYYIKRGGFDPFRGPGGALNAESKDTTVLQGQGQGQGQGLPWKFTELRVKIDKGFRRADPTDRSGGRNGGRKRSDDFGVLVG